MSPRLTYPMKSYQTSKVNLPGSRGDAFAFARDKGRFTFESKVHWCLLLWKEIREYLS
jgi:hypothetical protein